MSFTSLELTNLDLIEKNMKKGLQCEHKKVNWRRTNLFPISPAMIYRYQNKTDWQIFSFEWNYRETRNLDEFITRNLEVLNEIVETYWKWDEDIPLEERYYWFSAEIMIECYKEHIR